MENPEILQLRITDLARGGKGVAREDSGRVIFVPFTAPGDLVRVRVARTEKRYAEAEVLEILEASPERQLPPCGAFGKCGGCQWQHLPYATQWKTKVGGVRHALERAGITASELPPSFDELPAERIWEYRNRIQLRGFREELGFYAAGSHELVPLRRCEIARPELNAVWEEIRREGANLPKPYKVEVEVLPDGSVRKTWNSRHAASGFRQVHDEQNEKLRAWVGSHLSSGGVLLDLFGGFGNLSLPVASRMREVHCVDLSVPAVRSEDTPANFTYHRSTVTKWLGRALERGWDRRGEAASAVLDPPREGLGAEFGDIEAALRRMGVTEAVLVGCDPDAWVRDVSRFLRKGWRFRAAGVLDLFPQTPHVESLAVLDGTAVAL